MVYLYAPYRVGTYLAYTPTVAYVNVRNVSRVNFTLYRMPLEDFLKANGERFLGFLGRLHRPSSKNLVRTWSLDVKPELNSNVIYGTNLAGEKGASLDPGLYYLEVEAPPEAVYPEAEGYGWLDTQRQMLVVSGTT